MATKFTFCGKGLNTSNNRTLIVLYETLKFNLIEFFQDVINVRGRNQLSESLSFAYDRRNRGNRAMSSLEYDLAIIEYEKCLSIFEWVEPTDGTENWKKKVYGMYT